MVAHVQTIEELKSEFEADAQILNGITVLVLDISSACTGYSIIHLDFLHKKAKLTKAGAIWFGADWEHPEKYNYMANAITNYFWVAEQVDYIVYEAYSINPKKMTGVSVVPEMVGAIKSAAWENSVKVSSILPQTWRSILQIKKTPEKDFKQPTKDKVLTIAQVPEEVNSNITKQPRKTPSDLYDSIAIAWAWSKKLGFSDLDCKDSKYQTHVGVME